MSPGPTDNHSVASHVSRQNFLCIYKQSKYILFSSCLKRNYIAKYTYCSVTCILLLRCTSVAFPYQLTNNFLTIFHSCTKFHDITDLQSECRTPEHMKMCEHSELSQTLKRQLVFTVLGTKM